MKNAALQNLKRQEFRKIVTNPTDSGDSVRYGVGVVLARLAFLKQPSDENAVNLVVQQFNHEIEKLQEKGISRESWPKFLQDEHWKEKTYKKFGVPYPTATDEPGEVS